MVSSGRSLSRRCMRWGVAAASSMQLPSPPELNDDFCQPNGDMEVLSEGVHHVLDQAQ